MTTDDDDRMSEREQLARTIDAADDGWQHGIGSGGYDTDGPVLGIPIAALADAILAAGWVPPERARERDAERWEEGYRAGRDDYRGRVDIDGFGTPNPYRGGSDD